MDLLVVRYHAGSVAVEIRSYPDNMHQRTADFVKLLASYSETDRRVVAKEFAETFIDDGNVYEILSVLAELSPQIKNEFLDRVAQAPSSEAEWDHLRITAAGMSEAACVKAKITWRLCVERVRRETTLSTS